MSVQSLEQELAAIQNIISILEPFDKEACQKILGYVVQHLGVTTFTSPTTPFQVTRTEQPFLEDIRSLKENKKPRYATHMAAIVAYYLSEIAPIEERKTTIGPNDIRNYFKKAGFKLPKSIKDVLVHATQSGYFDFVGSGQYKLNPVGYNLVVHGLPQKTQGSSEK